jgi:hypothetical protein
VESTLRRRTLERSSAPCLLTPPQPPSWCSAPASAG